MSKGSGFGLAGNLVVGCVGAVLGGFGCGRLGMRFAGGIAPSIPVAVLGSFLFLWGARLVARRR